MTLGDLRFLEVSVVAKECLNAEARWVAEEIQRGESLAMTG